MFTHGKVYKIVMITAFFVGVLFFTLSIQTTLEKELGLRCDTEQPENLHRPKRKKKERKRYNKN